MNPPLTALCLFLISGWRDKSAKWEPPICGCKFLTAPPRLELTHLNPFFLQKRHLGYVTEPYKKNETISDFLSAPKREFFLEGGGFSRYVGNFPDDF